MVFPLSELMKRKNPDELVFNPCPGCMSEITSNVCFACDYAGKNSFYLDGFRNYSPNSPCSNEPNYQFQYDSEEDFVDESFDSEAEAWT